jgi:esterase
MTSTLRIDNDGVALHVEVDGPENAVPVLFLHGVTSCTRTWGWLPEQITGGRRIIRVDFRGHGRSGAAPGRYTVRDYSSDVAAVLREVAGTPAVLVGHSLGGCVAWCVAQTQPDLVRAALLEDPPLLASQTSPERSARVREIFRTLLANIRSYREANLSDEEVAERMNSTPGFRSVLMDDAVNALAFGHNHLDPDVLEGAIAGSTLADIDVTSLVKPPVLILAADDAAGAAFSSQAGKRITEVQPNVDVIRIDGCGHSIHDERRYRETFVRHLAAFLDIHAQRTSSAGYAP